MIKFFGLLCVILLACTACARGHAADNDSRQEQDIVLPEKIRVTLTDKKHGIERHLLLIPSDTFYRANKAAMREIADGEFTTTTVYLRLMYCEDEVLTPEGAYGKTCQILFRISLGGIDDQYEDRIRVDFDDAYIHKEILAKPSYKKTGEYIFGLEKLAENGWEARPYEKEKYIKEADERFGFIHVECKGALEPEDYNLIFNKENGKCVASFMPVPNMLISTSFPWRDFADWYSLINQVSDEILSWKISE